MDLDAYLSRPGSESMADFARQLGLNADQVRQWRHKHEGRRPSPANCAEIERVTKGLVTCRELRPDLTWERGKKDAEWPNGKPLLDVSSAVA